MSNLELFCRCSFPNWYERLKSMSLKSIVIPLPVEFMEFLSSNSIFIPSNDEHLFKNQNKLIEQIDAVIKEYGSVFPKLNWSSPKVY